MPYLYQTEPTNSTQASTITLVMTTINDKDLGPTNDVSRMLKEGIKPRLVTQFIASAIACIAAVSMGLAVGYTAPAFPNMESPSGGLPLTKQEESWVSSLLTVGALIGGLTAGLVVDFFGRKLGFIVTSIPLTIGWLFIVFAKSAALLYVGRLLTGVCVGIICLNTSVYITEIASPEIRGIVGSWFQLFVNLGILIAYTLGNFIRWDHLAIFCACVPVLLIVLISLMPESPVWLLRKGKEMQARKSLIFFRGENYNVDDELDNLRLEKETEVKFSIQEIRNPVIFKPLLIIEVEMFLQQFCGINAVVFNIVTIFDAAKMAISPNVQGIIVAVVMVVASIIGSGFMDKAGRRILLLIGAIVMTISLFLLGTFYYFNKHNPGIASHLTWLPIVCLMVFVAIFNLGFGPIPWLSMSELFPAKARSFASSLATATNWLFAFIITKTYVDFQNAISPYGVFWLYGSITFLGIFFIWFFVPETKGKSQDEMQKNFM